ncbi:MAG: hypothetical protein NVSMB64_13300 [Candidatus Velthaea sp.]
MSGSGETMCPLDRTWGMISRGTIIAALVVIELAIVGESVAVVRGGPSTSFPERRTFARVASGPQLVEGGPHQVFQAGAHPALTVDIGYADLTILTGKTAQIDVSASASAEYGMFRSTAPITAREDRGMIRIATTGRRRWSMGDDRMVTVLVPPQTQVTVVTAGDIKADGLRAEASFTSTGRGTVTIEDYNAPVLHVESSDGRIVLHRIVAARVDVSSSNSRVEGTALQVRDGSVESEGRITLGFAAGADTLVAAKTSNGRISVSGFSSASSAASERKSSEEDSASQAVRVGAGNGRLDVHSRDGNINLAQEG